MLMCGMFLAGCSGGKPVASNPDLYRQERIMAVDHWDNIAETVAKRIFAIYEQRDDLISKPVYVRAPNGTPFSGAFTQQLKTRLVTKGMQVSERKEADSLVLDYDLQVVSHNPDTPNTTSLVTQLGIGIANVFSGKYTSSTDTELIISSRISHYNRYVLHLTTVCYIPEEELQQYIWAHPLETKSETSRTIQVIGK